jgi:carboxylesterase
MQEGDMDTYPILPGAEPFSAPGGPHGALVLHGFTGSPQSMRGLAEAFARAGFAVELPRLPGHGTTVDDMATTGWSDWTAATEAAYDDLASRCERVVVAGLSMGGSLTVWLATRHAEIAGIVVVNTVVTLADEMAALRPDLEKMLADGQVTMPGVGGDIADPDARELAYPETPIASLLSLFDGVGALKHDLDKVNCPLLVASSPNDHVVPPGSSDHLAAAVRGPVTRLALERSFHVATLDHDKELLEREAVAFATRVTSVQ